MLAEVKPRMFLRSSGISGVLMSKPGLARTGSKQQKSVDHWIPADGGLLQGPLDNLVVHVVLRNCEFSGRLALEQLMYHIRPKEEVSWFGLGARVAT